MKTLFTQFVLASVLFGIGAENQSLVLIIAGLIFLILSIIFAISYTKKHKA